MTSDLAAGFTRALTWSGRRTLCPRCRARGWRRYRWALYLFLPVTPALLVVGFLVHRHGSAAVWNARTNVLVGIGQTYASLPSIVLEVVRDTLPTLLVLLLLITCLHEAGHALTARLVGQHVGAVSIGVGPPVTRITLGGTRVTLRLVPVGAHTLVLPSARATSRLRYMAIVAAGPLTDATLLTAVIVVGPSGGWGESLAWLSGLSLAVNLIPYAQRGSQPNDGLTLLELLRSSDDQIAEARALAPTGPQMARALACYRERRLDEAERWLREGLEGHPHDAAMLALLAAVLINQQTRSRCDRDALLEARQHLVALLESPQPAQRHAVARNNLAWVDLLLGDPDLATEATEAAASAYRSLPWDAAVQSTRGYALIEHGKVRDGLALASQALAGTRTRHDRATILAIRAIGHARYGRLREAEADLRRASRLDPDCVLLDRAAAELARCRRIVDRPPTPPPSPGAGRAGAAR